MGVGETEGIRYKVSSSSIKAAILREIAVWDGGD